MKKIIYGAGNYGKCMYRFLNFLGVKIDFFCQTEAEEPLSLEGIPIMSFQNLCKLEGDLLLFVAISDIETSHNICLRIRSAFLNRAKVFECANFLGMNRFTSAINKQRYCLICGSEIEAFLPGGQKGVEGVRLFREHHIIGGGWRKNYECSNCGCIDRERWQLWVLSKKTGIFFENCCVLHLAPEPHISKYISSNPYCEYYTGDIVPGRAMHQTDILDIQYKDSTFDYVIMNHVLEHIEDMGRAMSEVRRVMKPKGKLILSFPICTDMDTLELPRLLTPEERLVQYGQEDHVRLFGKDYLQRISSFGFEVEVISPREQLTVDEIKRYGFIEDDVLMVCRWK